METAIIFLVFFGIILLVFVIAAAIFGIRTVPQGSMYVVERFGKFKRTLEPGLNFILPFMDVIAHKVPTKDLVLDIPKQDLITRDNVVLLANAVSYIRIIHPANSVYRVDNYQNAIQNLIQTSLRAIIGEMSLDDALSSREEIKIKLQSQISDTIRDWGIDLKTVEIQDISPSESMKKSMEEEASAERHRRAIVTRAEGEKEAAILNAEGRGVAAKLDAEARLVTAKLDAEARLEAARLDAQAKTILADASQAAIQYVSEAIQGNELPVMFLLGEKYVEAVKEISTSGNAKIVMLPADIPAAVKGVMSQLNK